MRIIGGTSKILCIRAIFIPLLNSPHTLSSLRRWKSPLSSSFHYYNYNNNYYCYYSHSLSKESSKPTREAIENYVKVDSSNDDPVSPFLIGFHPTPLTQLAKKLPDEVIEKLENGLKSHLEQFPARYRLFRDMKGFLHVQRIREDASVKGKCKVIKSVETPKEVVEQDLPQLSFSRFMNLENFIQCFFLDNNNNNNNEEERNDNNEEERNDKNELKFNVDEMENFINKNVLQGKDAELWLLTEEYTLVKLSQSIVSETTEEKEKLQSFRWVQLVDADLINKILNILRIEYSSNNKISTRNSLYIRVQDSIWYKMDKGKKYIKKKNKTKSLTTILDEECGCIEDYNLYRMCRALNTKTFIQISELQNIVGEWLTQPLAAVLAIGGEESKTEKKKENFEINQQRSIFDFEYDPNDSTRIIGVRFWLNEKLYLPSLYHEKSLIELQNELKEFLSSKKKNLSGLPNHQRVRIIDKKRILQRCIALHEIGTSPLCHPDVLAYYIFDLLPLDNQLVLAGHLPLLLPKDIKRITEARSRNWIRQYPHLFTMVERAPELFVKRRNDLNILEDSKEEDNINSDKNFLNQDNDFQRQLLVDTTEQLKFVISIVLARLEAHKKKNLLPSHLPKFFDGSLRRLLFSRKNGGVVGYLNRYPEIFILTYGIHPHEPVITMAPNFEMHIDKSASKLQEETKVVSEESSNK